MSEPPAEKSIAARGRIQVSRAGMLCLWLLTAVSALAGSFTASLDRDTITRGESATLSLTFSGGTPQEVPAPPEIPNLQIDYIGPSSSFSFINGQVSSTVTHTFRVTPRAAGDYTIPALAAKMEGQTLTTQPVTLKVLKPSAPPPAAVASGSEPVFIKLQLPKKELFVGENMVGQIQLYVRNGVRVGQIQPTGLPADGLLLGKLTELEGQRRQVQVGNAVYTIIPVAFPLRAMKPGPLTLGPMTFSAVVEVPSPGRRRDSLFEQFGFRDPFGGGEQKQIAVASDGETLQGIPLPTRDVPPTFNGAVGSYRMTVSAGPTNVAAGDPITVRVQIAGQGAIDTLNLPEQPGWKGFKTYPPTAKTETADPFGLQGSKTFEQIVVPENPDLKALPPVSFSFFDPAQKSYRTVLQPAIPLTVRPGGALPAPTVAATARATHENSPPAQDIVAIKQRLGTVAQIGPPLIMRPWFLGLQSVPVLALVTAFAWRRRQDSLAHNPRLRRQRQVAQLVRNGLDELRRLAGENKSDEFFATIFRLLQEQLGERLDVPALSITEAVIDERLRPIGVPEATLAPLHELFQTCNLARYAPIKSSQELAALVPKLEVVLGQLGELKL